MDVLNKVINQNYDIKITDDKILEIVRYYFMINDYYQKCSYIRTIIESLNNKILDPDTFLTIVISELQTFDDLLLVALALRFGANPNLYLVMNGVGIVHLMVYTVMYMRGKVDNTLINYTLAIQGLLGSSAGSPMMKASDVRGRSYNQSLINGVTNVNNVNVSQWLDSQGYYDFSNPLDYVKTFPVQDQISIGCMVDAPIVAFPEGIEPKIITETIQHYNEETGEMDTMLSERKVDPQTPDLGILALYNAYLCARKAPIPIVMDKGESVELRLCLNTGSLEIFKELINRGFRFTYFSMNRLLVLLRSTVKNMDGTNVVVNKIFNMIYFEMLKYVIEKGVRMDKEQFTLLNSFMEKYAVEISAIYNTPLWIKSCSSSANVPLPDMVKSLAFSLNIDASASKPEVCAELEDAVSQNPQILKDASIARQRNRIAVDVHGPSDYATGRTEVNCKNAALINGNPFEYNDASLAYYVDSNKNLWCYTAPEFESIVSNPVNPQTGKPVPQHVINKMQNSLNLFKKLNVSPNKIVPVGEAIKHLNRPDTINSLHTEYINETIIRLVQTRGIYAEAFKNIPLEKTQYLLTRINMDQDYLASLTVTHRFATMCKALYLYFKMYPTSVDEVFSSL